MTLREGGLGINPENSPPPLPSKQDLFFRIDTGLLSTPPHALFTFLTSKFSKQGWKEQNSGRGARERGWPKKFAEVYFIGIYV